MAFVLFAITYCLSADLASAQCTNEISPSTRQHGHGGTLSNGTAVTVSPLSCSWSVQNTNPWITITAAFSSGLGFDTQAPFNGTGTGYISYAVQPNPSLVGRTGVVTVANQPYTIRQLGIPCNFTVSPDTRIHGSGDARSPVAATNDFDVLASNEQCPWTATTTNNWIHIVGPTSGVGSYIAPADGTGVVYQVALHVQPIWRTGYIHVADAILTIAQRPSSVCDNLTLSPTNATHGHGVATNQVLVSASPNCQWVVEKTNDWIIIVFGASGIGTETIRYRITENPSSFPREGTLKVMDEVYTITQAGAPCRYSLSPDNRLHSFHTEIGQFGIVAPIGCEWSIRNTNAWIDVLTDTNGSGPATLEYSINANPNLSDRTGYLMLRAYGTNVTTFRVRQDRAICTYRVSPAATTRGPGGVVYNPTTGQPLVTLMTSSNGCSWSISNTNAWVTTFPTGGSGGRNIGYTVAPNPYPVERVAVLHIGNTNFGAPDSLVITQRAFDCDYQLSPKTTSPGYGGGTNSFKVITTSTCPWTASTTNDWITISPTAETTGSNNVTYVMTRNPSSLARVGYVTVAGVGTNHTFTITQDPAPCSYSISPSGRTHGHGAVTADVRVVAVIGCQWTVINTNPWVNITTGLSGSGTLDVEYVLQPNTTESQRSGVIRIVPQVGDPMNFTVAQLTISCSYDVSTNQLSHGSGVETGSVSIGTSPVCQWDVVNTNAWITILSGASGTGNGTVLYRTASNLNVTARSGVLVIDGQAVTVNQSAYTCSFKFTPDDRTNGHGSITGSVTIATGANCSWTLANTNPWVTITAVSSSTGVDTTPPFTGTGNGSFTYTIPGNPYPEPRRGNISISDGSATSLFVLTQRGSPCDVRVSPTFRPHGRGASGGTNDVIADDNCTWDVINTNSWITITLTTGDIPGSGFFTYTIQGNPNPVSRTGNISVQTGSTNAIFTITQDPAICSYSLSPPVRNHGHGATNGTTKVVCSGGCTWSIDNTNSWISILAASGLGSNEVLYAVEANTTLAPRIGYITFVGDDGIPPTSLVLTVNQDAATCTWRLSATERTHGFGGSADSVVVTTLASCSWLVINTNTWITITTPLPAGGTNGTATINYSVTNNPFPVARTGTVMLANQTLTLMQRSSTDGPPFAFQTVERDANGDVRLRLGGAPAGVWRIDSSSNLITWTQVARVTNVTGVVDYVHPHPAGAGKLFYRAILQP